MQHSPSPEEDDDISSDAIADEHAAVTRRWSGEGVTNTGGGCCFCHFACPRCHDVEKNAACREPSRWSEDNTRSRFSEFSQVKSDGNPWAQLLAQLRFCFTSQNRRGQTPVAVADTNCVRDSSLLPDMLRQTATSGTYNDSRLAQVLCNTNYQKKLALGTPSLH